MVILAFILMFFIGVGVALCNEHAGYFYGMFLELAVVVGLVMWLI